MFFNSKLLWFYEAHLVAMNTLDCCEHVLLNSFRILKFFVFSFLEWILEESKYQISLRKQFKVKTKDVIKQNFLLEWCYVWRKSFHQFCTDSAIEIIHAPDELWFVRGTSCIFWLGWNARCSGNIVSRKFIVDWIYSGTVRKVLQLF